MSSVFNFVPAVSRVSQQLINYCCSTMIDFYQTQHASRATAQINHIHNQACLPFSEHRLPGIAGATRAGELLVTFGDMHD